MKKIFTYILALSAALTLCFSCQEPEDLTPSVSRNGINSFKASFPDDDLEENAFYGEIDYENHTIVVVIPYTYPAKSEYHNTEAKLLKMRVEAGLDDNVTIDPPIYFMDLTQPNYFTLTDQRGDKFVYTVTGEIRKSADCSVEEFAIPSRGLISIIDNDAHTIGLLTQTDAGSGLATYSLAFGATIDPDPATTEIDYDQDVKFTITAQDGHTTQVYTVTRAVPTKRQLGMREGSSVVLWQKKLPSYISTQYLTNSIATLSDYVVVNTRGEDLLVLSRKSGEKVGTIPLSFKGSTDNFCITSDDADNILVCNLTPNSGNILKVYKIKGINGTPELYFSYDGGGVILGRRISILGNLDSKAVITVPIGGSDKQFLKFTVQDGVLNTEPQKITVRDSGLSAWNYNCDIIMKNFSATSDYYLSCYADPRCHLIVDGSTNTFRSVSAYPGTPNWVPNSVDYVSFNNNPYVVYNSINSFTWGSDDIVYLYDVSANSLDEPVWKCDKGTYGSMAVSAIANKNYGGDVALRVSDDGFFMYLYFMFCDGYIACVQFDCIDK